MRQILILFVILMAASTPGRAQIMTSQLERLALEPENTVAAGIAPNDMLVAAIKMHDSGVTDFAFTADGLTLATAGMDHKVKLWSLGDLPIKSIGEFDDHKERVLSATFSNDGAELYSVGFDHSLRVRHIAKGASAELFADREIPRAVRVCGPHKLAVATESRLLIWDLTEKRTLDEIVLHAEGDRGKFGSWESFLQASSANQVVVTAAADRSVRIWDASGKSLQPLFSQRFFEIPNCAMTSDGKWFASAARLSSILLSELVDRRLSATTVMEQGHEGFVEDIAISNDHQWVATLDVIGDWGEILGGNLIVCQTEEPYDDHVWRFNSRPYSIAFHPDNRHLFAADEHGRVFILRLERPAPPPPADPCESPFE